MNKYWHQLKFIESTENLKTILSANSGRSISHRLCNNIMSCLQQGRSFFEIAELSPLEIKPLIVFYGMMGFARAIIMARTLSNIETLPQKHGLSDISPNTTTLETLALKVISNNGTFHLMNDSISNLEKFIVHRNSEVYYVKHPTVESQALYNKAFTLRDILARIHGVEKHYLDTFNENAKIVRCSHFEGWGTDTHQFLTFQVFPDSKFKSKEQLLQIIRDLRNTFDFLRNWSFEGAGRAGGFTSIEFTSQRYQDQDPEDNSDVLNGVTGVDSYGCQAHHSGSPVYQNDILSRTAPISGGLSADRDTHIIEPFEGLFLSEFSLFYMGMFLLSSLVRYRPDIWSNTLSRRAISNNPVDDKALSLIEHFIEISLSNFPQFVVSIIKEPFS